MKFTPLITTALAAAAFQASAVQYDFSTIWTGGTPGGTSPFARLTVLQDAPNVVSLRLDALSLTSDEFISKFDYNIAGTATTAGIGAFDDLTGGVGHSTYVLFGNEFTDASLNFDASVFFPTAGNNGGAARFKGGESFMFKLIRPGLTVDDIDLDMMIHIQGIAAPSGAETSSKIIAKPSAGGDGTPVPDAGNTLTLLGLGALGILAARRR